MADSLPIFDFATPSAVQAWRSIDDRIMGGCSLSRPEFVAGGGLLFRGVVSLDNGGGFASIRSPESSYRLDACEGLLLQARGDGRHYRLGLRTDRFFDGVSYQAGFAASDEWEEIYLPFIDFTATHHGRQLTVAAPLDPAAIQSFGLFIGERQRGPFHLEVAWIRGWPA